MTTKTAPTKVFNEYGDTRWTSRYPSAEVSVAAVKKWMYELGVGPFHFGRLLGLPDPRSVYRWLKGEWRPSALYWPKITMLVFLKLNGRLDIVDDLIILEDGKKVKPDVFWSMQGYE